MSEYPTAVFVVCEPIEEIDALPGDYLIVRAGPTMAFTLQRDLPASQLRLLARTGAVRLSSSVHQNSASGVSASDGRRGWRRPVLRLRS